MQQVSMCEDLKRVEGVWTLTSSRALLRSSRACGNAEGEKSAEIIASDSGYELHWTALSKASPSWYAVIVGGIYHSRYHYSQ